MNVYSNRIRIGPPLLLVKDIERELRFYGGYFDLQPIRKYQDHLGGFIYDLGFRHLSGSSESLPPLISLQHSPDAKIPSSRSAGLFHKFKEESNNKIPFPKGGIIGHMHLKVTNLERSIRFYHEKLGLDITANMTSMGAAFFSEGGYHHHIAINTLYSLDGDVHREDVTGLKNFTIIACNASFYNSIKSNIIMNDPTTGNQMAQNGTSNNKFTIMDPDGIQIVIRTK